MQLATEINRNDFPQFVEHLTVWMENFEYACLLNSNSYPDKYGEYELLAAVGEVAIYKGQNLKELRSLFNREKCWLFGHVSYDFKNQLEQLTSQHTANFNLEQLSFFKPRFLFKQSKANNKVECYIAQMGDEALLNDFIHQLHREIDQDFFFPKLKPKIDKAYYLEALQKLQEEIQYGNIYEINYCQEFFAEEVQVDPSAVYIKLNKQSPMPFSAFYKCKDEYLMCASPERYFAKKDKVIISQPIKGTMKRGTTKEEDEKAKHQLQHDLKEQTENVMIVDLVRNDLARTAARGSVEVESLFKINTFPQVHQLISTIKSILSSDKDIFDVIETTFPMGSMTGAPKISAMQLADKYERSKRELYSGTLGYITPEGNGDFNVVIRSLMYTKKTNYMSLMVGGAITQMSLPEEEYKECLVKAKAIFDLQKQSHV